MKRKLLVCSSCFSEPENYLSVSDYTFIWFSNTEKLEEIGNNNNNNNKYFITGAMLRTTQELAHFMRIKNAWDAVKNYYLSTQWMRTLKLGSH